YGGNTRTHQNSQKAVGCELFQDLLHLVARSSFQSAAHHLHAVQKQRQSSQKTEKICNFHFFFLHIFCSLYKRCASQYSSTENQEFLQYPVHKFNMILHRFYIRRAYFSFFKERTS